MSYRIVSLEVFLGLAVWGGALTAQAIPMPSAGLKVWLKADALTGLTNGAPVDSWTDSSGNGNAASNTGVLRPTWQSNIVNGLPAIRFDGITNYLQNTGYSHGTHDLTLFMVARRNGNPARGYHTLFIGGTDYLAPTSPNFYQLYAISNTTALTINFNTAGLDLIPGVSFTNSMFRILALSKDNAGAGSDAFHVDGVSYGSGTGTQTLSSKFYIGGWNNGNVLNGDIAEIALYNTSLGVSDRELVEGLLAWKYGLQDNLPVSHSWKSSNPALVPVVPTITNAVASFVSSTGATLNGLLISTGGAPTTVSVYWGSADGGAPTSGVWEHGATFAEGQWGEGSTPGTNVTLPTPNITYYYRYAASNSAGVSWASSAESFFAADRTCWIQAAAGTNYWTNSANWSPAVVPNMAGIIAVITNDRAGDQTIIVHGTNVLGELIMDNTNKLTLVKGTGATFRFDNGSGNSRIRNMTSANTLDVGISYGSGAGLDITNEAALAVTEGMGGFTNLVKSGSGTLSLYSVNTFKGDLIITGGTVDNGSGSGSGSQIVPDNSFIEVTNNSVFKTTRLELIRGARGIGRVTSTGGPSNGRLIMATNTSSFTPAYGYIYVAEGGVLDPGFGATIGNLSTGDNSTVNDRVNIKGGDIYIDLASAGSFDKIILGRSNGTIIEGGNLHLNFLGGYMPTNGASWDIMTRLNAGGITDPDGGDLFSRIDSNVGALFVFTAQITTNPSVRVTAIARKIGTTLMVQ